MRLLGTADLPNALGMTVGFRNVLVREYILMSEEMVSARLDHLAAVERFVEQVAAVITGSTGPR